jgi:hypothetical protein
LGLHRRRGLWLSLERDAQFRVQCLSRPVPEVGVPLELTPIPSRLCLDPLPDPAPHRVRKHWVRKCWEVREEVLADRSGAVNTLDLLRDLPSHVRYGAGDLVFHIPLSVMGESVHNALNESIHRSIADFLVFVP